MKILNLLVIKVAKYKTNGMARHVKFLNDNRINKNNFVGSSQEVLNLQKAIE